MRIWFVTDPGKNEVSGSHGISKDEAKTRFVQKMEKTQGEQKPWAWWKNQGYKLRRMKR